MPRRTRGPVYRSSHTFPDDRATVTAYLRDRPTERFQARHLSVCGVPSGYVRRALTEDDDTTGIPGVRVTKDGNGDFWFEWVGTD